MSCGAKLTIYALIIPAFDELAIWAGQNNVSFAGNEDLVNHPAVVKLFQDEIEKHNRQFARVEQIRRFKLLPSPWSQETGELTPTLKLKRRIITEKYAEQIEEMYQEAKPNEAL